MVSPVQLSQVVNIADVLQVDHFSLLIPNPPGGGDGEALLIKNLTAALPGLSTVPITTKLHRHTVHHQSRQEFGSYTIAAQFVESTDRAVIQALIGWHNQKVNQLTGLPNPKSTYATTAYVTVYDSANNPSEERTLINTVLETIQEVSVGGESASLKWSAVFRYDNWQPGGL